MDHGGEHDDVDTVDAHDGHDAGDSGENDGFSSDHEDHSANLDDTGHDDPVDGVGDGGVGDSTRGDSSGHGDTADGAVSDSDPVPATARSDAPVEPVITMHDCAPGQDTSTVLSSSAPDAASVAGAPANYSDPMSTDAASITSAPGPVLPAAATVQPAGAVLPAASSTTPPGMVAPIPGTQSGYGTPTSFDAAGRPTHVTYTGVVNPPQEMVTFGGNSALYDGTGRSMVPTPAQSGAGVGGAAPVGGVVQNDPTHVTLGYVPQQLPSTEPPAPKLDPYSPAGQAQLQLRDLYNQTNNDINTLWTTGVSVDRSGGTPTYYGNGKPFSDFGNALGEERHPTPP